ncbi:ribose ABC transporter permease, partial [Bacillus sp. D-CC]
MAKKGNVLQQLGSLIGLALIIVVITALNPAFIEIPNLFNILRQV